MALLYTKKCLQSAFLYIFLAVFYLFVGCSMQQFSDQSLDAANLFPTFPPYFSIQAVLHFINPGHSFRGRMVCSVAYDRQIHFIVKGPLGIEVMRGLIDKKGVTLVDRLRRLVYQWDYNNQSYDFYCNYSFIQSLLLGTLGRSLDHKISIPNVLPAPLAYIYDPFTSRVIGIELVDRQKGHWFRVLYQYKVIKNKTFLSGIKIDFSLKDKKQTNKGRVILHKLDFKGVKKPNIRLKIPGNYRNASSRKRSMNCVKTLKSYRSNN
ncbi:Hypothetical protein CHV_a0388 [Cardinium endosymbiont cBtQ1 of Bemisia tabaci]|nr:Hypothetical protein CHV_a0388 [Cardinium endosymbiont cBtQ1 of Bemisia tabaci]